MSDICASDIENELQFDNSFEFNNGVDTEAKPWDFASIRNKEASNPDFGTSIQHKVTKLVEKNKRKGRHVELEVESDGESSESKEEQLIQPEAKVSSSFVDLHLARPLLKALSDLGFNSPTSVQEKVIPKALKGSDILVNAETGSGKTAAFALPILERLIRLQQYVKSSHLGATRVLVVCPTRELAAQVFSMTQQLASHSKLRCCLVVGGLSPQVQEAELLKFPDIVVGSPGRLVDLIRNSKAIHFDNIEVLVLDEADRLLELGFTDQVKEVVKACPESRQTMLFSATLTPQVNSLASISLNKPEFIAVSEKNSLVDTLTQEFIRIRSTKDSDRDAVLLALCTRSFTSKVLVFCRSKVKAHRLTIAFSLLDLKVAQLHGNMTQNQRLEALDSFRDGKVDYLICTDLAARGLDILGLESVINLSLPAKMSQYIHRVGRTARAGRSGRAISLVGESKDERRLLKVIVGATKGNVKSRVVPIASIEQCKETLKKLQRDINLIILQEKDEKALRVAEMNANRAENLIRYDDEIKSRPAKTWFQTKSEKIAEKKLGKQNQIIGEDNDGDAKTADSTSKEKKVKKDPFEGLSRVEKRKKMAKIEAEKKNEEKAKFSHIQMRQARAVKTAEKKGGKKKDEDNYTGLVPKRKFSRYKHPEDEEDATSFARRYAHVALEMDKEQEPEPTKKRKATGNFKSKKKYKRK